MKQLPKRPVGALADHRARQALAVLVATLKSALDVQAIWLWGSCTNADYLPDASDLDLLIVTGLPVEKLDLTNIETLHAIVEQAAPEFMHRLDVCYLGSAALAGLPDSAGLFAAASRGDPFWTGPACSALIALDQVRRSGITLLGPSPRTLMPAIPRERVRTLARQRLADWQTKDWPALSRGERAFITLTACRIMALLDTRKMLGKYAAATYANRRWPDMAPLIAAALACRATGYSNGFDTPAEIAATQHFLALLDEQAG